MKKAKANNFYSVGGKPFPIIGHIAVRENHKEETVSLPIVDIPYLPDYRWQMDSLRDRLEHPDAYPDEDVHKMIEQIQNWLASHP